MEFDVKLQLRRLMEVPSNMMCNDKDFLFKNGFVKFPVNLFKDPSDDFRYDPLTEKNTSAAFLKFF